MKKNDKGQNFFKPSELEILPKTGIFNLKSCDFLNGIPKTLLIYEEFLSHLQNSKCAGNTDETWNFPIRSQCLNDITQYFDRNSDSGILNS